MHPAARNALAFLAFFGAVIGFTFVTTFVHEVGHATAWGDVPVVEFHDDRASAEAAIAERQTRTIDGRTYHVDAVDDTTVALYPKNILLVGVTLGLAPAQLLPDAVLGSTFYSLDDEHYHQLAAGEHVTQWHHAAMPMIINGLLAIPIVAWVLLRTNPISIAALWVNASEWRFNLHHAQEIGIDGNVYLAASLLIMLGAAMLIGVLSGRRGIIQPLRMPNEPTAEAT